MKYTIDRMEANEGETMKSATENGNYELCKVGEFKTLEKALDYLNKELRDDEYLGILDYVSYDLRAGDEVYIYTIGKNMLFD